MRLCLVLLSTLAYAQAPGNTADPSYEPLRKAYEALKSKDYAQAIVYFEKAIFAAPARTGIRKDLAYTYLKIGEREAARDQFGAAMGLDPDDSHVALEFAFLCFETKQQAQARRVFDRIRKVGDPVSRVSAETAFQNIDRPLAEGIDRLSKAIQMAPGKFTTHYELAGLAEQRDELALAAEHYAQAWRILPGRKSLLVDLGRVWKALNRTEDADAALLAASRGGEPRASEAARELLPPHYPYVSEFRRALDLDPKNIELRRELAFLLLAMDRQPEAEREFRLITEQAPEDLLSSTQLGFLYLAREEKARAMKLFDSVLRGSDVALSNRIRATLKIPLLASELPTPASSPVSADSKILAERSFEAGYLADALQYLHNAHEADPDDAWVQLKLGWTYNILRNDKQAIRWFGLARTSSDSKISSEARKAYRNLHAGLARFRTTVWVFPFFSTRWHDLFSYGQVKTDMKLGNLPLRPYISMRFLGDTKGTTGGPRPEYLSERSAIVALGLSTSSWRGLVGWGEAGSAISFVGRRRGVGQMIPDYRGGLSFGRSYGPAIGGEPGFFVDTSADGLFISRYDRDFLAYVQNRIGYTAGPIQLYWNNNFVRDLKGLSWANSAETGPGVRFRWHFMPRSLLFSVNFLRGKYAQPQESRSQNYFDVRAGFWYAATF